MIEFSNQSDMNVWSVLEDFDFDEYPDICKLRVELYLAIIKSIGYCGSCTYYNKQGSHCSLLDTKLSSYERCSNFNKVEQETESAFDVMSEEFRREQENLSSFAKIRKYQRRPNIIRKDDPKPIKEDKLPKNKENS